MINRREYLLKLKELCGDEDVDEEGLILAGDSYDPLFIDLYGDGYSIDLNTDVLGYLSVEELIYSLDENMDSFDVKTTAMLASLIQNKRISKNQHKYVEEAVAKMNEALFDPQMQELIWAYINKYTTWNIWILQPARLALMLIHDPESAQMFRSDLKKIFADRYFDLYD